MLISFSARTGDQSVACSFCNIKLLRWFRASINSTVDLTRGFRTLGKMNTLEWLDLVTLFEVHTLPKIFGVFVKNTSKILSYLVGVLTSCERPLCCVRDFKSSLLMSPPIISLAFDEVVRMLSQEFTKQSIKAVSW